MAQQIIENGQSGLVVREALNEMFTELYGNTPVPIKMGTLSANTDQLITSNTFLATLEIVKVSGIPVVKIGTTPGGEEIFPLMELSGFSQSNVQLYCDVDKTIYFTISGGTIKARLDVINNYL